MTADEKAYHFYMDVMQAFDWIDVETAYTLIKHLYNKGRSITEFMEYVEFVRVNYRRLVEEDDKLNNALIAALPVCSDCGTRMKLYAGDDNDGHFVCGKCRLSKYLDISPEEYLERYGIKEDKYGTKMIFNTRVSSKQRKKRGIQKQALERLQRTRVSRLIKGR